MKKIAVFTSGGDAPGMNASIRAVVRTCLFNGKEVVAIKRGYDGMINGLFEPMTSQSVSNIIQRGGTILKTARSKDFLTQAGMKSAKQQLEKNNIEGVIAIGGDGTFKGAKEFSMLCNIPFIGIPGTIDNDLFGSDFCIGYDTALNTVVQAVDKIRDTADSHDRLFIVEVMGKDAGLIALRSGIGVGAEQILMPETFTTIDQVIASLLEGRIRKKSSNIILVAEGWEEGGALVLAEKIKQKSDQFDIRVSILGHIQRGGSPTCADRVLASRLGVAAVEGLIKGQKSKMVGIINNDIVYTPFEKAVKHITVLNEELLHVAKILAL